MDWHSLIYGGIIIVLIYGLSLLMLKKSDVIEQLYQMGKKEMAVDGGIVLLGIIVALVQISRIDINWERLGTNNIGLKELSMTLEWMLNKNSSLLLTILFIFGIIPALCVFSLGMSAFSKGIVKTTTPSYYFLFPSVLGIALTLRETYTLTNTIIMFLSAILLYVIIYCINTGFSLKRLLALSVILILIIVLSVFTRKQFNIIAGSIWIEVILGVILCLGMKYAYYLRETLYRLLTIIMLGGMVWIQVGLFV